jgi:octanoyl-[GcvH]:protein N-octanoyltransferase
MPETIFCNQTCDIPAYSSFEMKEMLEPNAELIHLQRYTPTVLLGRTDERLPYYAEGVKYLQSLGFAVLSRNSGGLAVVLDEGVLTMSLTMANPRHLLHVGDGFVRMSGFINRLVGIYGVAAEVGEVTGSYCPGKFDMSVDGRKFAGIAARVTRQMRRVDAYLCVEGSGAERAEAIRLFYEHAGAYNESKSNYPIISPTSCASLQELLDQHVTVESFLKVIKQNMAQVDHS